MADRTTPIANTLLNADATPNAGLPVSVQLLVPGNVAAQDATLQVIGTTPLPFVTNAAGTWAGAVIPPGDLTPAGCRYQVTEGARVTISPSFAYTPATIVVATWYASPPSSGLILMYLTELEANALANPGATFSAAISQDAVWTGGAGTGQVIGAGAPPVQLQTNSSGTWQAYFPPSSQLNPSTTFYSIVLDSGISLAFTAPTAYTGDQGAYNAGTTYATNAVVQVVGVPYTSLAGGNVGHAPASSPAFWSPYQGESITGRLTTAVASGQIALGTAGIAHSANVPSLVDDPIASPATLDDDLRNLAQRTGAALRTITASATTLSAITDDWIIADGTSNGVTITLPAVSARRRTYFFIRKDAAASAVSIAATGGQTINGGATLALTAQFQWAVLHSDGSAWYAQTGTGGAVSTAAGSNGSPVVPTNYMAVSTAATTTAAAARFLCSVEVIGTGGVLGQVTIYDNTTATGSPIWQQNPLAGAVIPINAPLSTGLTVVTAQATTLIATYSTSPASSPSGSFSAEVAAPDFRATGLTGATAASRYVGATASGAPVSGTFAVGDHAIDQTGKVWVCTVAGTPGTWTQVGSSSALTTATAALGADVAMTAGNTYYDTVSVSLAAGTWMLVAEVEVVGANAIGISAKLWDGTTVFRSGSFTVAVNTYTGHITMAAIVTPGSTTTYKISVAGNTTGGTAKAAMTLNGAGNNATALTAVKVG